VRTGASRMRPARRIAQAGVIAATYAALTFLVLQLEGLLAWGIIQFRFSEALTVLACLTPAAIPGLTLGTALANLSSVGSAGAIGWLDVGFGSLGTLLGAVWSWRFRRTTPLALAGPVIFNALIVPAYLPLMLRAVVDPGYALFGVPIASEWWILYLLGVATVGLGEAAVVYGMGWPLLAALRRMRLPGLAVEEQAPHGPAGEERR
jgi:uncharacterized membrane protein